MPPRAHVTSVEAIESFKASLIIYLSKARPALEEVSADVLRTRLWLENDQRIYWENQVRLRTRQVEEAQAALFSATLSSLRQATAADHLAVHKAKRAREDAVTKLRLLKQWNRQFDSRVEPLVKQMEKLHTVLSNDMVQALAYLTQTVNALAAYAGIAPPSGADSGQPAGRSTARGSEPVTSGKAGGPKA